MAESIISQQQSDWVLVWTNANPTSSFSPQTVSIDLSGYSWIKIEVKFSTAAGTSSDSVHCNYFIMPIDDDTYSNKKQLSILSSTFFSTQSNAPYVFTRNIEATSSGVTFGTCYRKTLAGTTAGTTVTDRSIPCRIWAQE